MAPKNTDAQSLVDIFPWLFQNIDKAAQGALYGGTGNNTGQMVIDPLKLNYSSHNELQATNYGENPVYLNPGNVDVEGLNRMKCLRLRFNPGACVPMAPFPGFLSDILGNSVGAFMDEDDYISKSPALFARLQYDSCTNQTILPMALNPNYVFNDSLRQHDASYNESWCQPFKMKPIDCYRNRLVGSSACLPDPGERDGKLYDYRAWGYLRLAWKSVLNDPYTPSGGTGLYYAGQLGLGDPPYLTKTMLWNNAGIPALTGATFPGTLELVDDAGNPIDINAGGGEKQYGDPFISLFPGGMVGPIGAVISNLFDYTGKLTTVNDLAAEPYERIWDPTHPYSPRWDFKLTDRTMSLFSRITNPPVPGIGFSTSTSTCIVRCAAVPVDILSFRLLAFSACMGCRVGVNSAIWWTEALYLTSDVEINVYGFAANCKGVSLDRAVDDTTRDRINGPLTSIFYIPNSLIPGFSPTPVPPLFYGRVGSSAGDYVNKIKVFGFSLPDCGESFSIYGLGCGGCHLSLCPPCMLKSMYHNIVNPDLLGVGDGQPQRNKFDSLWPICSTKYDVQDATLNQLFCEPCTIISGDINASHGVRNCCDDVAHAVAPLNTLKIRNTIFNPGLKPTPEGYAFEGYWVFRDDRRVAPSAVDETGPEGHMPYMRWWDTGTAAGGSAGFVGIKDYDPDSDCGTYDTIVGVGTEDWNGDLTNKPTGSAPADGTPAHNLAKYCRYGGNGFAIDADRGLPLSGELIHNMATAIGITPGGYDDIQDWLGFDLDQIGVPPFYECIRLRTIDVAHRRLGPDAMTSWDELKIYQTRAIQRGLNCLPQYEKMHKPFAAEDAVLNAAGGSYTIPVQLNRNSMDNSLAYSKGPAEGYYKIPYRGKVAQAGGTLGSDPNHPGDFFDPGSTTTSIEMRTIAWPLAWRGYVSDPNCDEAFPQFAGDGTSIGMNMVTAGGIVNYNTLTMPCGSESPTASMGWTIPGSLSPLGNYISTNVPGWPEIWPIMPGGLTNAKVGDIVYLTMEDINYSLAVGYVNWFTGEDGYFTASMPAPSIVRAVHTTWTDNAGAEQDPKDTKADCPAGELNCFTKCQSYVIVEDVNNGKFPDACGNTDMYGHGHLRTIYKEWLPEYVQDVMFPAGMTIQDTCGNTHVTTSANTYAGYTVTDTDGDATSVYWGLSSSNFGSCADPKMAACTYADYGFGAINDSSVNLWNHFRIYRPTWDIRQ